MVVDLIKMVLEFDKKTNIFEKNGDAPFKKVHFYFIGAKKNFFVKNSYLNVFASIKIFANIKIQKHPDIAHWY